MWPCWRKCATGVGFEVSKSHARPRCLPLSVPGSLCISVSLSAYMSGCNNHLLLQHLPACCHASYHDDKAGKSGISGLILAHMEGTVCKVRIQPQLLQLTFSSYRYHQAIYESLANRYPRATVFTWGWEVYIKDVAGHTSFSPPWCGRIVCILSIIF